MEKKHNGFTLVEIIVSIAIASVVLMIAGAMILSSSNFMMTTTEMDLDKRATDSIIDFVRDEIEYSTDVRFVPQDSKLVPNYAEDSDWHYFYIQDGELYRDGERLFDKNFANKKSLSILMQGNGTSESNHRLDIKYTLINSNNETTYSSRDTVMFLNLSVSDEILKNGLYSDKYIALSNDGYWLFYTKKAKDLTAKPDRPGVSTPTGDGTVADIKNNITGQNFRGLYLENTSDSHIYKDGEIVWYNGYYWERITENNANVPGEDNYSWKRLTREYTNPNLFSEIRNSLYSGYEKGDVVVYNNKYYEVVASSVVNVDSTQIYRPWNRDILNSDWKLIGNVGDSIAEEYMSNKKYSVKSVYKYQTIWTKYFPSNLDPSDPLHTSVDSWNSNKTYKIGDIVKKKSKYDSNYYHLYIKRGILNSTLEPGTSPKSGWTKIDIYYDSNSFYSKDDNVCVRGKNGNNGLMWVTAIYDIDRSFTEDEIATEYNNQWNNPNWKPTS